MPHKLIKTAVLTSVAIATAVSTPVSARHDKSPIGSTPPAPSAAPDIVRYVCGSSVSVDFANNSLLIKSDANGDAGFVVYTSQSSTVMPYAPGTLTFTISGAQPGDSIAIEEFDVNGHSNATDLLIQNGRFSYDLSNLTKSNIKKTGVLVFTRNLSTIQISKVSLNGASLPFDLNFTQGCN